VTSCAEEAAATSKQAVTRDVVVSITVFSPVGVLLRRTGQGEKIDVQNPKEG
jgi:hypothetical protein